MTLKPFGNFLDFRKEISHVIIMRSLLIVGAIGMLSPYLIYDYSKFFPRYYQMEVFFDESGLTQSLNEFSSTERRGLFIPADFKKYQEQYFKQIDSEIQRSLGAGGFFNVAEGYVHSEGRAELVAEKTDGWQNYHVEQAEGELKHILEVPNKPPLEFYSRFERLPSEDDYVRPSPVDLFFRHSITLRTRYKQILMQSKVSEGLLFKVTLVGITKITIFPWPHVSRRSILQISRTLAMSR